MGGATVGVKSRGGLATYQTCLKFYRPQSKAVKPVFSRINKLPSYTFVLSIFYLFAHYKCIVPISTYISKKYQTSQI